MPPRHPTPTHRGRTLRPLAALVATLLAAPLFVGCAMQPPKPWEKGLLAKPEMTFSGDPLDQRFTQHTYTSKEAASGGTGVGGGGCGCN